MAKTGLGRISSREYLVSYGWKEGEALQEGGLKKPILVKHKWDRKGLGKSFGNDDGEVWWEKLFDGKLKDLDVNHKGEFKVKSDKEAEATAAREQSPLYKMFVKGEGLKGTIKARNTTTEKEENKITIFEETKSKKRKRDDVKEDTKSKKKAKKEKKMKKEEKKMKKEEKKRLKKEKKKSKAKKHKE